MTVLYPVSVYLCNISILIDYFFIVLIIRTIKRTNSNPLDVFMDVRVMDSIFVY